MIIGSLCLKCESGIYKYSCFQLGKGPSKGSLCDCEIFACLRITFVWSSNAHTAACHHADKPPRISKHSWGAADRILSPHNACLLSCADVDMSCRLCRKSRASVASHTRTQDQIQIKAKHRRWQRPTFFAQTSYTTLPIIKKCQNIVFQIFICQVPNIVSI